MSAHCRHPRHWHRASGTGRRAPAPHISHTFPADIGGLRPEVRMMSELTTTGHTTRTIRERRGSDAEEDQR
jgi:hypothetical protein